MNQSLDTWWKSAVIYQIYPRSFHDSNNDGVGDIKGITNHFGYLELLEVDAIWLSPIMKSPMADHGYDVSNPREVDPLFGSLADLEELIAEAHQSGIKLLMDLVPNHTSNQHEWFLEAVASPPGSPARERYIFRDGQGDNGELPPNNWQSVFGGPAWTQLHSGGGTGEQWYLHLFSPEQPDLNWDNPEVWDDLEHTLRFWLDKGVDGFRIDVAHGMSKPAGLPDMDDVSTVILSNTDEDIRFNQPGVHEIHRKIRSVLNEYPHTTSVGEVWVRDNERFAEYLRPDELHMAFNFRLTEAPFETEAIRQAIEESLAAVRSVGGVPTWALSNHDVFREVTRYAEDDNLAIGTLRARALFLVIMALPGTVFIYQGAELGLFQADVPQEARQDPVWERSGKTAVGRDGARIPLPWEGNEPPFGFSENPDTWLPITPDYAELTVERQLEDPYSTFSLYRATIEIRKHLLSQEENVDTNLDIEWFEAPEQCFAFRRTGSNIICALNGSEASIAIPPGQVILSSAPLVQGVLPPYSAVWIKS